MTLVQVDVEEHKDDILCADIVKYDSLHVDTYAEADQNLGKISTSVAIDVLSSLHKMFSTIQKRCHLYDLKVHLTWWASFAIYLWGLTALALILGYSNNRWKLE